MDVQSRTIGSTGIQDPHDDGALRLIDVIRLIWRRKLLAATAFVLVAGGLFSFLQQQTPIYEASARLSFSQPRRAVPFDDQGTDPRRIHDFLSTERDRILSAPMLDAALAASGAATGEPYASSREPTSVLRGRTRIDVSDNSWTMGLAVRDESPEVAESILAALVESHLRRKREAALAASRGVVDFLGEQIVEAKAALERARLEAQEFRRQKGLVSSDPDENHHAHRLGKLQEQRFDLESTVATAQALCAQIDQAEALEPAARREQMLRIPEVHADERVAREQSQLLDLRDQHNQNGQRYGPKHPVMREMVEQMRSQEAQLDEVLAVSAGTARGELARAQGRLERLDGQIAAAEEALSQYRLDLIGLAAREKEIESRDRLLEQMLKRHSEEDIVSKVDAASVEVLDPPEAWPYPVNARKKLHLVGSVLAGAVVACALALVFGFTDGRVRGQQALSVATGAPSLGQMSILPDAHSVHVREEAYRMITTNLLMRLPKREDGRVVFVTGVGRESGTSFTAISMVECLVASGQQVLLIDSNLYHPRLHQHYNVAAGGGLASLLLGDQNVVPTPLLAGFLDLLPAGDTAEHMSALWHSERLDSIVAGWRQRYSIIVIDSAPPTEMPHALLLSRHADLAVVVARYRHDRHSGAAKVVAMLKKAGVGQIATVVNGARKLEAGDA